MIIIGEKINAARKSVRKALLERDLAFLQQLCREQDSAGANYIDVNVGTAQEEAGRQTETIRWLVNGLEEVTEKPLCIDSENPAVIQAGLAACTRAVPMINSVNGDVDRMNAIFPLAAELGSPIIALAMGGNGIPDSPAERLDNCRTILDAAAKHGITSDRLFFDPLVLPLSTGERQGRVTLDTLALLKEGLKGTKTVLGLSNISFGLPRRSLINGAFLTMAIGSGLDAVLLDPTDRKLISHLRAAEVASGRDRRCRRYIKAHTSGVLTD